MNYIIWRIDAGVSAPLRYFKTDDRITAHRIAHLWNRRYPNERYAVFPEGKGPRTTNKLTD